MFVYLYKKWYIILSIVAFSTQSNDLRYDMNILWRWCNIWTGTTKNNGSSKHNNKMS